ncbi:MAG: UvrD-helicase domain-containing protein [Kiritimatiellaeota bacterium]|nr:UvrD-helicase domain-containing protein [Kiritimatiellota bacterium]
MIFNASAGTGKTWQVTELYCALVLGTDSKHLPPGRQAVPPEKILLMTFTDNAAAELRKNVSKKLIAAEEENDLARSVLRKLPASHISTIHAFCAGLLREHALGLGLSPTFQTLEDEERDALLDDALKAELFQTLENDADFRDFCGGVSVLGDHEYSVINTIRSLLEKAASRGLDLSDAEAMLPKPERTVGRAEFQNIYDRLAVIDSERGLPAKAAKNFQTLELLLQDFPMIGKIGELTKFTGNEMKPISDELAELKEQFLTETLYAENISTFRAFARCLARCALRFAEAKRSRDCVDFGDQLLLARDLLKNNPLGAPPFEWIIVDEVQDTSRVQCEVVEALWASQTNLVVCGDKKQSIYAWRSADPDVMPDLEKAMEPRGEYKQIPLVTSYRSKDRVIEAVNELFGGIYESYDALEPRAALTDEKPCVEFLEADNEDQGSDEEMAAVARRIRLLVNGGEDWRPKFGYDNKTKDFLEGQSFDYGDILILLKRSTHQAALEKALRDAGIPYSSGGKGKALFEQQEVRDLLLFLQVMTQPQNDLALVGFLRSPFANLPDETIVQLGWDGETFDREILRKQFFETASIVGQASLYSESVCEDTRSRVREARPTSASEAAEMILRYRAQVGSKLPSQLVREIARETAFDAHLAGQPGGEQKLANFKKALDWIRAAERGGQVLAGDVVRRFERAIQTPPKSGAAEALLPSPEQDSATIMTVHGAKGLTQRVCFVPDISFGDVNEPGFAMFSPQGSLEMNISDLTGGKVASPGWKAAREADKAVRDAESTNVFYVAMTRARDLVVVSGAGTQRVGGWMKLGEPFFKGASDEILCRRTFSEMPEIGDQRSEGRDQRSEVRDQGPEVSYISLKVPAGVARKPVTSLVEHLKPKAQGLKPANDRRAFGTLGHAVLEELAKNNWAGNIPELLRLFGANEYEGLEEQLEAAREVLAKETAGAELLFAEHPFVLKRGDLILDGTIDLLAQFNAAGVTSSSQLKILDYKFSDESPEAALETYGPQLAAYKEAVEALHPGEQVSAALVLIGAAVRVISLRG